MRGISPSQPSGTETFESHKLESSCRDNGHLAWCAPLPLAALPPLQRPQAPQRHPAARLAWPLGHEVQGARLRAHCGPSSVATPATADEVDGRFEPRVTRRVGQDEVVELARDIGLPARREILSKLTGGR